MGIVKQQVKEEYGSSVSSSFIRVMLKSEMELKFCKVKKLANQINSLRNLHMRQKFAKLMIDYLADGKRILNIDETWIA